MNTINGTVLDTGGNDLGVLITVTSQSTPQFSGAGITTNTVATLRSDPTTGDFTLSLVPGQYLINFATTPNQTNVTIVVPGGPDATYNFGDLVTTTPAIIPGTPPNMLWNGQWNGSFIFLPQAAPVAPTTVLVSYAGGNINAAGNERYSYWISWVTANGETNISPVLAVHEGGSPTANKANRILLPVPPAGVTFTDIWRTTTDNGSTAYDVTTLPLNVGLLATVPSATAFYDDWESTAAFVARVTGSQPPLYNTSSGQIFGSAGNISMQIAANGYIYYGQNANIRIVPNLGAQIYNTTTRLWYTLLNTGALGAEQWSMDSGNTN